MSRETNQWLQNNVLRGFTDVRGKAWWASRAAADDTGEANHYPGAIPVDDLYRRLFGWKAEPLSVLMGPIPGYVHTVELDGVTVADPTIPAGYKPVTDSVAWARNDNWEKLGIHSPGYLGHQFAEWCIEKVESIVGKLQPANAGLLKRGAVGWVQMELPDNVDAGNGIEIRPYLMATTSFDGSIATTYKLGYTDVVCDNTREMFLREAGATYRRKHTSRSQFDSVEAIDALSIVHRMTDEILAEITALTSVDVSERDWSKFVEAHAPINFEEDSKPAMTRAETKRETLTKMWNTDTRVAPWHGTAWGVVQAVNTYVHHEQSVRNVTRVERNMMRAVEGGIAGIDRATLATLSTVMGRDLIPA